MINVRLGKIDNLHQNVRNNIQQNDETCRQSFCAMEIMTKMDTVVL